MQLTGLINRKIKCSSLIEVLFAMIIILISFTLLVGVSTSIINSNKVKDTLIEDYLVKKEYLNMIDNNLDQQNIYIHKNVLQDFLIESKIAYMSVDSLQLFEIYIDRVKTKKRNTYIYFR